MMTPVIKHAPPQNLEAEQATLGAMLMERDAIARVVTVLEAADFHSSQHQILYRVMTDLFNEGTPVDLITVMARFRIRVTLKPWAAISYLLALQDPPQRPRQ